MLTFHRSKGLEFPVVYCPFLWDPGRLADQGEPVYFHDDVATSARSTSGSSGAEYDAHLRQHNVEERGEELRLAYVALTRARHQAVIWWASAWYAKDSPLGRLLFAQDAEGNVDWQGGRRPREDDALRRFEQVAADAPARGVGGARAAGTAGALERCDRRRRDTRPRALRAPASTPPGAGPPTPP